MGREADLKKIDLHIHTVSTISDRDFEFSLEKLCSYVASAQIDAIAITEHPRMDDSGYLIIYNNNLLDSVVMFSTSQLL